MKYTHAQIEKILTELFNKSYRKAISMMMNRGYSLEESEDRIQDTFENLTVLMTNGTDSDINEAYFMTSVKNAGLDISRKRITKDTVKGDDINRYKTMEEIDFSHYDFFGKDRIDVKLVLDIIENKIQPEQKEAIHLVYFRGYTAQEASKIFNIKLGTLLGRLRNGYEAVRMFYNLETNKNITRLDLKKTSDIQRHNNYIRKYRAKIKKDKAEKEEPSNDFLI